MQHPDDPRDCLQILLGHLEPNVERLDELGTDLFAWVGGDVGVWLEQDLILDMVH
jgi:hypothetical protein